jgi:hypothetical protein
MCAVLLLTGCAPAACLLCSCCLPAVLSSLACCALIAYRLCSHRLPAVLLLLTGCALIACLLCSHRLPAALLLLACCALIACLLCSHRLPAVLSSLTGCALAACWPRSCRSLGVRCAPALDAMCSWRLAVYGLLWPLRTRAAAGLSVPPLCGCLLAACCIRLAVASPYSCCCWPLRTPPLWVRL